MRLWDYRGRKASILSTHLSAQLSVQLEKGRFFVKFRCTIFANGGLSRAKIRIPHAVRRQEDGICPVSADFVASRPCSGGGVNMKKGTQYNYAPSKIPSESKYRRELRLQNTSSIQVNPSKCTTEIERQNLTQSSNLLHYRALRRYPCYVFLYI